METPLLTSYTPTAIHFGDDYKDAFTRAIEGYTKALIVIGTGSVKRNGALAEVSDCLTNAGVTYDVFEGVEPNPTIPTVLGITDAYRESNADVIVAFGGGSVLDAAKMAPVLRDLGGEMDDYFGTGRVTERKGERDVALSIIAFPTTSGTGSEVTPYSNIVNPEINVKRLVADPAILPSHAFVVPRFTYSCPRDLTAVVALDAFAHCLEGYLNDVHEHVNADANERACAGMRLIIEHLPRVYSDVGDEEGRKALAYAATLGGTVIRYKSTGLPHMFSFSWAHVIDHGKAVATIMPYVWRYYIGSVPVLKKTLRVAEFFGVYDASASDEANARAAIDAYVAFLEGVHFPTCFRGVAGFDDALLVRTAKDAEQNRMKLENAPRPVPAEDSESVLLTILRNGYEGCL